MKSDTEKGNWQKGPGEESFGKMMNDLFMIRGYKASVILTRDGELLFSNFTGKGSNNPDSWTEVFNNLFAHACHLTATSGFLGCNQLSIRTGDELVVIRSSNNDCLVGVRMAVMFDHLGNEAVINLKLEKVLPELMRYLTWDPDNLARLYLRDMQKELPGASFNDVFGNQAVN